MAYNPNFYDPKALGIDPNMPQAPVPVPVQAAQAVPAPTPDIGFGAKLAQANSGNRVLGMPVDEFIKFAGSIGAALMPEGHPLSRLGQAMAAHGEMLRNQRLKEQDPVYQAQQRKLNALQRQAEMIKAQQQPGAKVDNTGVKVIDVTPGGKPSVLKGLTNQPGISVGGQAPAGQGAVAAGGGGSAPAMGSLPANIDPELMAELVAQNPWLAQEKEQGLRLGEAQIGEVGARTESHKANTAKTQEEIPLIKPLAMSEIGLRASSANLQNANAANIPIENQFKRQQLGLEGARIGLARQEMNARERDRKLAREQLLMEHKSRALQAYGESAKGLQEKQAKDLQSRLASPTQVNFGYGMQYIQKGLVGRRYAEAWKDPEFANVGADLVHVGVGNVIQAINAAPTPAARKAYYHQFMKQIEVVKTMNPALYGEMWNQLHGGLTPFSTERFMPFSQTSSRLLGMKAPALWGEKFDPALESKAYGGRLR